MSEINEGKVLPSGRVVYFEKKDCTEYWYYKTLPNVRVAHNEGAPAFIHKNGDKSYYYEGQLHRLDGPAVEDQLGVVFYIEDTRLSEEDYWKHPKVIQYKYLKEHPELKPFT